MTLPCTSDKDWVDESIDLIEHDGVTIFSTSAARTVANGDSGYRRIIEQSKLKTTLIYIVFLLNHWPPVSAWQPVLEAIDASRVRESIPLKYSPCYSTLTFFGRVRWAEHSRD